MSLGRSLPAAMFALPAAAQCTIARLGASERAQRTGGTFSLRYEATADQPDANPADNVMNSADSRAGGNRMFRNLERNSIFGNRDLPIDDGLDFATPNADDDSRRVPNKRRSVGAVERGAGDAVT